MAPWYVVLEVDPTGQPALGNGIPVALFAFDQGDAEEYAADGNATWAKDRLLVCEVVPVARTAPGKT